jgi:hypothetical protein
VADKTLSKPAQPRPVTPKANSVSEPVANPTEQVNIQESTTNLTEDTTHHVVSERRLTGMHQQKQVHDHLHQERVIKFVNIIPLTLRLCPIANSKNFGYV